MFCLGLSCCCGETYENISADKIRKNRLATYTAFLKHNTGDVELNIEIPSWVRVFNNKFYQRRQMFVYKKLNELTLKRHRGRRRVSVLSQNIAMILVIVHGHNNT